jgi:hypothetical protein
LKYSLEQKVELGHFDDSKDSRIIPIPVAMFSETEQIYSNPQIIQEAIESIIQNEK